MVRKALNSIVEIFRVVDDQRLMIEQMKVLSKQLPILYLISILNGVGLAIVFIHIAPLWLTLLPLAAVPFCMYRAVHWWRRAEVFEIAVCMAELRTVNRLCLLISIGFALWGITLSQYGDTAAQLYVVFFMITTMIACVFCLMCMRSAAAIVTVSIVPVQIFFCVTGSRIVELTALNFFLFDVVVFLIIFVHFRDFKARVYDRDILERLGKENGVLANRDMLTGLPNRRDFFSKLDAAASDAASRDAVFAVGMIDLDGFKPVNDTYGHAAGDAVLREVAERLNTCIGENGFVARLGGDEFGLILHGGADTEQLGRSICDALGEAYHLPNGTAQIGASIGFARYPDAASDPLRLCECADYALYHAKNAQRGTAIMFTPEHESALRSLGLIEQTLRHADLETEFGLVFQPLVDGQTERILAFEALARWKSPHLGNVSPAEFITVAERAGLIHGLTEVLFAKALAAMADWPDGISLSFNLSTYDIASSKAVARISALLVESGIPPERIIFEVTETAMMRDFAAAQHGVGLLKKLGVSIALDDFGTGYSSLSYVYKLPIDKLKIDRAFITEIGSNSGCRNIVKSVLELCLTLDIDCVTEGVETAEQKMILRTLGNPIMQGYLFEKPMGEHAVGAYLASQQQTLVASAA